MQKTTNIVQHPLHLPRAQLKFYFKFLKIGFIFKMQQKKEIIEINENESILFTTVTLSKKNNTTNKSTNAIF